MKKWVQNQAWAIRACFLLMIVFGIIMSVMVPSWQIPDEYTHITMIGESMGRPELAELFSQDMNLDYNRIVFHADEKLDLEQWKDAIGSIPTYSWRECMPCGLQLSAVKHLPAMLGILLGVLLHLPTFWVLELAELCALLFYISVCWCAVRLMPMNKEILLMVMAFPMTLQQAASFSYDAVLLPICFLFVAYIFHMRCEKARLGWKDVASTVFLLVLIMYIKLPYVLLGLLVFLLPKEKICLKLGKYEINETVIRKFRIPAGTIFVFVFIAILYMVRNNFLVQMVGGMLMEWKRTLYLFHTTIRTFWRYLIVSSVGQFGWLDSQLPFGFVMISYILLVVMAVWGRENMPYQLKGKGKLYLWIVFSLLFCLTFLTMVNHTIKITLFGSEHAAETYNLREAIYRIPYIGGLQGRYFIPFLTVPFFGMPQIGHKINGKAWIVAIYIIFAMAITIRVLYFRYWV